MKLHPENLYHIYNRGNNKQKIFFQERNYSYFLNKFLNGPAKFIDLLAYCLMPNHFHFLIYTPTHFVHKDFSSSFRILLSSYTRAIHKQETITGSLFQQNSKAKQIDSKNYGLTCFNYIHQNPYKANLVIKMEKWPYSSFNEYLTAKPRYCNQVLAYQLLDINSDQEIFYNESYAILDKPTNHIFV